jgi:hypothetical protein
VGGGIQHRLPLEHEAAPRRPAGRLAVLEGFSLHAQPQVHAHDPEAAPARLPLLERALPSPEAPLRKARAAFLPDAASCLARRNLCSSSATRDSHPRSRLTIEGPDPTKRFSDRVANYIRYRPGYPQALLGFLRERCAWAPAAMIADLGSGTGISSEYFLRHGNTVYGVEPNDSMRDAAEDLLARFDRFHSVSGSAEATTLPDGSVDLVVAAQAFHWFDVDATRREVRRILRPDGHAAIIWNERRVDTTPFLRAYEALLLRHGTDYEKVRD